MLGPALTARERGGRDGIPLRAAMGRTIVDGDGGALTRHAPLEPNRNVHGTGFAGSLYAAAALCGWGRVALTLEAAGLDGELVIAEGTIRYRRPVTEALAIHTTLGAGGRAAFCDTLRAKGRARLTLAVFVNGTEAKSCARFEGVYAAKLRG